MAGQVSGGLSVLSVARLFEGGITYGCQKVIQREAKVKIAYVSKLRKVLVALATERSIPDLASSLLASNLDSLYYHYEGTFRVSTPLEHDAKSTDVIRLSSRIGQRALSLDCSLRFFSEGNVADGIFQVNSGNQAFLKGSIELSLATVLILLNRSSADLVGSPLFLKLTAGENDGCILL